MLEADFAAPATMIFSQSRPDSQILRKGHLLNFENRDENNCVLNDTLPATLPFSATSTNLKIVILVLLFLYQTVQKTCCSRVDDYTV